MVNNKVTVAAHFFNWDKSEYIDEATPGASCKYSDDYLMFACPGCGRFSGICVSNPKPVESPSWLIQDGSLDDVTNLTLVPSINCVGCCGWHGYLTKGIYVSC